MFNQTLSRLSNANDWPILIVAGATGILLGIACLVLPSWLLIGLFAVTAFLLVTLQRPEVALLLLLVATSTIIAEDELPRIPGLYSTDILLLALFGLIVVRALAEREFKLVRTPLDAPLLAFYGIALLATALGLLRGTVTMSLAVTETRYVTYYLVFFIVTNLVRNERQLHLLVQGIIGLGILVALAMVAQYVVGRSVRILPGRVETLVTEGAVHSDITRVTGFAGEAMILTNFILCIVLLILAPSRFGNVLRLAAVIILGIGLIITFNRNFWIGAALAGGILAYVGGREAQMRMLKWGAIGVLLLALLLGGVATQSDSKSGALTAAALERIGSLFKAETVEPDATSTLRWRDFEYAYTLPSIAANPFLGLGLGAQYRPRIDGIDYENFNGEGYTHNAHVWIMVKTGLIGYLCVVWLSVRFLRRSFQYWRLAATPFMRGTMLAFALTYIAVLIGSIVNPMLMQWYWMPIIGIMMGVNEVIIRLSQTPQMADTQYGLLKQTLWPVQPL